MPRAQRLLSIVVAAVAILVSAPAVMAQDRPADGQGMRYLAWPGKPVTPAASTRPTARPSTARPGTPRRPAPVIPHGGSIAAVTPDRNPPPPRQGLTPATTWMAPRPASPAPIYAAPAPAPTPVPTAPPAAFPAPSPAAAIDDPMAPRRDAPIFRMQQGASSPQPQSPSPTQPQPGPLASNAAPSQGALYYSVHRQNGRQPDSIPLPAPFFLDSVPVDLAEPPAQPSLMRNADGRIQAAPATDEPSLP